MLRFTSPVLLCLAATAAFAGAPSNLDQLVGSTGLQRVRAPSVDVAYVRPGASMGAYDRLLVEPVDVAFRADWNPRRTGSYLPLSAQEREQLRGAVTQLVQRAFDQEVQQGRLKITNQAGPGVLRVKARLVDLYLSDAGGVASGRSRVLTTSSGEATMVAELSDAQTGEVLARLGDWEELRSTVRVLRVSSPTRIASDVESTAANWGRTVRDFVAAPMH